MLKDRKEIEENFIIQKKVIEKINETKEKEWSNYIFVIQSKITIYRWNRRSFVIQPI